MMESSNETILQVGTSNGQSHPAKAGRSQRICRRPFEGELGFNVRRDIVVEEDEQLTKAAAAANFAGLDSWDQQFEGVTNDPKIAARMGNLGKTEAISNTKISFVERIEKPTQKLSNRKTKEALGKLNFQFDLSGQKIKKQELFVPHWEKKISPPPPKIVEQTTESEQSDELETKTFLKISKMDQTQRTNVMTDSRVGISTQKSVDSKESFIVPLVEEIIERVFDTQAPWKKSQKETQVPFVVEKLTPTKTPKAVKISAESKLYDEDFVLISTRRQKKQQKQAVKEEKKEKKILKKKNVKKPVAKQIPLFTLDSDDEDKTPVFIPKKTKNAIIEAQKASKKHAPKIERLFTSNRVDGSSFAAKASKNAVTDSECESVPPPTKVLPDKLKTWSGSLDSLREKVAPKAAWKIRKQFPVEPFNPRFTFEQRKKWLATSGQNQKLRIHHMVLWIENDKKNEVEIPYTKTREEIFAKIPLSTEVAKMHEGETLNDHFNYVPSFAWHPHAIKNDKGQTEVLSLKQDAKKNFYNFQEYNTLEWLDSPKTEFGQGYDVKFVDSEFFFPATWRSDRNKKLYENSKKSTVEKVEAFFEKKDAKKSKKQKQKKVSTPKVDDLFARGESIDKLITAAKEARGSKPFSAAMCVHWRRALDKLIEDVNAFTKVHPDEDVDVIFDNVKILRDNLEIEDHNRNVAPSSSESEVDELIKNSVLPPPPQEEVLIEETEEVFICPPPPAFESLERSSEPIPEESQIPTSNDSDLMKIIIQQQQTIAELNKTLASLVAEVASLKNELTTRGTQS